MLGIYILRQQLIIHTILCSLFDHSSKLEPAYVDIIGITNLFLDVQNISSSGEHKRRFFPHITLVEIKKSFDQFVIYLHRRGQILDFAAHKKSKNKLVFFLTFSIKVESRQFMLDNFHKQVYIP